MFVMTESVTMTKRRRRSFSPAFKAEVVELCRQPGRNPASVSAELDLTETAVRRWVAAGEVDAGVRPGLTSSEREELSALRRENRTLREERDILKRAVGFFAREIR